MMRRMRRVWPAIFFIGAALGSAGCGMDPWYLLTLGGGQINVLLNDVPMDEAIADPDLDEVKREKLLWVRQVREYAAGTIGLNVGDSYQYYYDTQGGPAVYNLSASARDRLEPKTWSFPIAGTFQYLGFFKEQPALDYRDKLVGQGYDVVVYGAVAYSTGGWLPDPLYSSLLGLDDFILAETVFHELTHNTVYKLSDSAYSESVANFVGKKSAIEFYRDTFGESSEDYQSAIQEAEDRTLVNDFLSGTYDALLAFYGRTDLTSEQKITEREAVFQAERDRFQAEIRPQFHDPDKFAVWGDLPTNNAWVLLNRRYNSGTDVFEAVYEACGRKVSAMLDVLRSAEDVPDSFGYLQEWVVQQQTVESGE